MRGLACAAEKQGAVIYEHTPALKFDAHTVTTARGIITAKKVVVALESVSPYVSTKDVTIVCSQAMVTEPLSDEQLSSLDWNMGEMLWPADYDYICCRKIGNRLFICKPLSVHATLEEMRQNRQGQIGEILSFFPTLIEDDLIISHAWSGLMVDTHNERPYVREQDGCYEVGGCGGNGLTNGVMIGKIIADYFTGHAVPGVYKSF